MTVKTDYSVSIITVCLNEHERIGETLSSIINQVYTNKEIIVIDGGSNDGTLDILDHYKQHIKYLISEKDDGIYHAMNKGASLAKGDYIQFINGGDKFYNENVLADIFSKRNISEEILYGNVAYVYPSGNVTIKNIPPRINYLYLTNNTINHQSAICKSSLFSKLGGFDTRYSIAADYDFLVRAIFLHNCSIKHICLTMSYFYKDGISHTGKTKSIMRSERIQIQNEYFPRGLYYFSRFRYWLIDHKDRIFPKWAQKIGNSIFYYLFKPKSF